uniref:Tryptophan--tRNA ligase n=1 Tax=Buchnera aphidicola (Cinara cedri) TaxID=261318 RepID=Q5EU45_9GAMM|nr:tryptophanyl-tRNA synthetase [Buchnera aphidicola (Cinara cedri)]
MKFSKEKEIMFTGIQPSGSFTLGNYCGTMCNWYNLQKKYKCFFCISDLHAFNTIQKASKKYKFFDKIFDLVALYLSCGVNPKKSIIFVQFQVHTHSQLYWILSNFTYFGELFRMTQFKKKKELLNNKEIDLALFCYPVLMAADILLYKTNFVSIGLDQKQHLELVQNIAYRFNRIYKDIFVIPKILIKSIGSKIMALQEPKKKMSKSDVNIKNTIFLLDNIDLIRLKLQKSLTDSDKSAKIIYDTRKKPGISNLLSIFSSITKKTIFNLENEFKYTKYSIFKKNLSDVVCDTISNIQKSYFYFRKNKDYLIDIINLGKKYALNDSLKNLFKIYKKLGF